MSVTDRPAARRKRPPTPVPVAGFALAAVFAGVTWWQAGAGAAVTVLCMVLAVLEAWYRAHR